MQRPAKLLRLVCESAQPGVSICGPFFFAKTRSTLQDFYTRGDVGTIEARKNAWCLWRGTVDKLDSMKKVNGDPWLLPFNNSAGLPTAFQAAMIPAYTRSR